MHSVQSVHKPRLRNRVSADAISFQWPEMLACLWCAGFLSLIQVRTDLRADVTPFLSPITPHAPGSSPLGYDDMRACTGVAFSWNIHWILNSYPFSIHRPGSRIDPGYNLLSVDVVASVIRVRSKRCTGSHASHAAGCVSCLGLGPAVNVVRGWAQQSPGQKSSRRKGVGIQEDSSDKIYSKIYIY
jgi:hypothetical protein